MGNMPLKNGKEFSPEILKENVLKIEKIFKLQPEQDNITIIINGKDKYAYNRKEFYDVLDALSKEYGW